MADGEAQVAAEHLAAEQLPRRLIGGLHHTALDDQRGFLDRVEDGEGKGIGVGHGADPNRPA